MAVKPTVSVVIPCYNYAHYVAEAIESVLAQTYPYVEIILIDDGSSDTTADVAAGYKGSVQYYFQENRGLSAARNAGITKATGEYIIFLDADDRLVPEYVERTVQVATHHADAAFVYTQQQYFEAADDVTTFPEYDIELLKRRNFIPACTLLRAELLKRYQYDTRYSSWEDWDFYLTLAEAGHYGVRIDEPLILYRKHEDKSSMLDTFDERRKVRMLGLIRFKHWRLYGIMSTLRFAVWYVRNR